MKMKKHSAYKNFQDEILNSIVSSIVATADPDKVILFGSRARGKQRKDSDYDICVLKKYVKRNRTLAVKIRSDINVFAPIDIIVTTPSRYEELKDKCYFVYSDVEQYGKVVYEKR